MMGRTHILAGMASAILVCRPATPKALFACVVGGVGLGMLCDIECRSNAKGGDELITRVMAVILMAAALGADHILKTGLTAGILGQDAKKLAAGGIVFLVTFLLGRMSEHRTFTHSLLYVALISFSMGCFSSALLFPALAGGLSHLVLDTLNKKPIPWLYPFSKKGICLKLFYADRLANGVIMWSSFFADVALLLMGILNMLV